MQQGVGFIYESRKQVSAPEGLTSFVVRVYTGKRRTHKAASNPIDPNSSLSMPIKYVFGTDLIACCALKGNPHL